MTEQTIAELKASMGKVLEGWWEKESEKRVFPLAGPNSIAMMVNAAMSVLMALADEQIAHHEIE